MDGWMDGRQVRKWMDKQIDRQTNWLLRCCACDLALRMSCACHQISIESCESASPATMTVRKCRACHEICVCVCQVARPSQWNSVPAAPVTPSAPATVAKTRRGPIFSRFLFPHHTPIAFILVCAQNYLQLVSRKFLLNLLGTNSF